MTLELNASCLRIFLSIYSIVGTCSASPGLHLGGEASIAMEKSRGKPAYDHLCSINLVWCQGDEIH